MYSIDYDEYGNPISGDYLGSGVGEAGVGSRSGVPGGVSPGAFGGGGNAAGGSAGGRAGGGSGAHAPGYIPPESGGNAYDPNAQFGALVRDAVNGGNFVPGGNTVGGGTALTAPPGYRTDSAEYYNADAPTIQNWLMQNAVWDPSNPFKAAILPVSIPGDVVKSSYDYLASISDFSPSPENYAIAAGNSPMLTPYGNYTPEQARAAAEQRQAYEDAGLIYNGRTGEWVPVDQIDPIDYGIMGRSYAQNLKAQGKNPYY